MKFEHIVQVNDLEKPDLPTISREQLWDGLVCRTRQPDQFIPGLDHFRLIEDRGDYLQRCLELPGLTVHDQVWLEPQTSVHYKITPAPDNPGGSLTMQIEEPEPGALFVRFTYCSLHVQALGDELPYDLFVQQAYVATDIETIQIIRKQALS